jgi:hypothetical protein
LVEQANELVDMGGKVAAIFTDTATGERYHHFTDISAQLLAPKPLVPFENQGPEKTWQEGSRENSPTSAIGGQCRGGRGVSSQKGKETKGRNSNSTTK